MPDGRDQREVLSAIGLVGVVVDVAHVGQKVVEELFVFHCSKYIGTLMLGQ